MKSPFPNRKELKETGEALSWIISYLDSVPASRNFDHAKKTSDLIGFFVRLLFLSVINKFLSIAVKDAGLIQFFALTMAIIFFSFLQIYFTLLIASLFGKVVFKTIPSFLKMAGEDTSERWKLIWGILFAVILFALQWSIASALSDMAERQLNFRPVPEQSQSR